MSVQEYLALYYGDKNKASESLEKWISLYENSPNKHTNKVVERINKYKSLLSEINSLSDERV